MMNQNPQNTLPSPQFYDRSLKTLDIKGAYPNKPWIREEVFQNRSLYTNDIRGAQPKQNIRDLNQPHYDPSYRVEGFQNTNFSRAPGINSGNYQDYRAPSNRGAPVSQSGGADSYFRPAINSPDQRSLGQAPLSSQPQLYQSQQQSQYGIKSPYQGTQGYNPERSSQAEYLRGNVPQYNNTIPKSPQLSQSSVLPPQSYLNRPASNPNIPVQKPSYQMSSPSYAQGISISSQINPSGIQNNYRQLEQQQQKFQQSMRPMSNTYIPNDEIVENFKHTALIRPNHYDSQQKYQEFKNQIESRIISPKHYDIPDKMVKYQMSKDNTFSFQQPKLKINREKLERQYMTKSAITRNQFLSSTPNLIKDNFQYQPTPSQQLFQSQVKDNLQVTSPKPLIQPQYGSQSQQAQLGRIPTTQSRPKTNTLNQENLFASQQLKSDISPKYNALEKNIFQKPQSAARQSEVLSYLKPYTVVPKVDNTTEYITKYNQSPIQQLQKSITPAPRADSTQVPWDNRQQDYNMLGNYVMEKREYNKTDPYGRQVDKYYKVYDGPQIQGMRKDINEVGTTIPYDVKFKYEKTKDNYYTIESSQRMKDLTSSYLNAKPKSFVAGKSDLFQVYNYKYRDPVNPNKFFYAEKESKSRVNSNLLY